MDGSRLRITEYDDAGKLTATYVCSNADESKLGRVDLVVSCRTSQV